jgi:hypothetical protein
MTTNPRKLRTPEDHQRFRLALITVDEAMWASEQRWGVGRLERIISPMTLAAYKRGWDAYRAALDDCDGAAVEAIGPKMVAALAFMEKEAEAAGHQPLAPDVWEADMGNGVVLVVCRTSAEASAVLRASRASDGASYETTLPPDLAVTVRQQHEGRALCVITMAEIARLLQRSETALWGTGTKWEGTPAASGRQLEEMAAHDMARSGYPMPVPLAVVEPSAVVLDF